MEYRKFGKTGVDISAIGFGCWEIGGGYGSIEETDFIKAINRALDDLSKQGKVKAVGLSNFKLNEIEAWMKTRRVDVVQYCWNMFDRRMQKEIFPYCRENNIGVMAYGSLAYGMLTGTLSEEKAFEKGDWRAKRGQLMNMNLFQHLFGPEHFLKNLPA